MNYTISSPSVFVDGNSITITLTAMYGKETIGYINGKVNSMLNCVECDTAVKEEYRGNGIAGKLLKSLLNSIFIDNVLDEFCSTYGQGSERSKVVLNIDIENYSSRRVAEKTGFSLVDSESRDSLEYEMTKDDYLKIYKESSADVKIKNQKEKEL